MTEKKDPQEKYVAEMSAVLSTLTHAPGWDIYVDILTNIRNGKLVDLLSQGKEGHDRNVGIIMGLDLLLSLPARYKARPQA